ncbi:hypothetical protein E2C01_030301 [Portunus trituberculatus]|uniref:Uncharacterized protein n=1 Tax=Portunus trituberculatus TaxID=210409 RepID=A0A5B7EWY5_PORTR|nr:hypothetical protein [Portunus trituberculatus]
MKITTGEAIKVEQRWRESNCVTSKFKADELTNTRRLHPQYLGHAWLLGWGSEEPTPLTLPAPSTYTPALSTATSTSRALTYLSKLVAVRASAHRSRSYLKKREIPGGKNAKEDDSAAGID